MSAPSVSFGSGIVTRLVIAAGYAALIWFAVRRVESRNDHTDAVAQTVAEVSGQPARLELTATYPVAEWTVRVNGTLVGAVSQSSSQHWLSEISSVGATDIFVDARRGDPLAKDPSAIRVRLMSGSAEYSETLWGTGAVCGTSRFELRPLP
jgi:hypothetical protein